MYINNYYLQSLQKFIYDLFMILLNKFTCVERNFAFITLNIIQIVKPIFVSLFVSNTIIFYSLVMLISFQ